MKVVLTSGGETLAAPLDPRFGRAGKFILWDSETEKVTVLDNQQSLNAPQGAGIQAALTVVAAGAEVLITGHCGPKAFRVLQEADVKVYLSNAATCEEALKLFQTGKLNVADGANVEGHW